MDANIFSDQALSALTLKLPSWGIATISWYKRANIFISLLSDIVLHNFLYFFLLS